MRAPRTALKRPEPEAGMNIDWTTTKAQDYYMAPVKPHQQTEPRGAMIPYSHLRLLHLLGLI